VKVGVLGAGQLARMLALTAHPLGIRLTAFDPAVDCCAAAIAPVVHAAFDDADALQHFAAQQDVITFDFENVPAAPLLALAPDVQIHPSPQALELAQDRLREKNLFRELHIPTAEFLAIDSADALRDALKQLPGRAVLKTRQLGYDGKGQIRVDAHSNAQDAWQALSGAPCILEHWVPFSFEVSQLAVRGRDGEMRFYPLSANVHQDGVLHLSYSPCLDPTLSALARQHVEALLLALDYVGLLAVEFFVVGNQLIANEMAPRVHNSGHFSIEGSDTSQFENHLRAITGLPLGSTAARGHSLMLNFLGKMPSAAPMLRVAGSHWHDYGKAPRPGRKVGHLTVTAADRDQLLERAAALGIGALAPLLEGIDARTA
jgi:5-(carboxyamino)imidazole ribonucleotide synthase